MKKLKHENELFKEALQAGAAPRVVLQATHAAALRVVKLADLKKYALDVM